MKIAVIGAGWAGLAAAVRARQAGHAVTLFETAPRAGGRARSDDDDGPQPLDNGQHILLGGYARTLALMRSVGVDGDEALLRQPLAVRWPDGTGFALQERGIRWIAAARSLWQAPGFTVADKLSLVRSAAAWRRARFDCDPSLTVSRLLARTATPRLRQRLLEPLCVAALNTPVDQASARVFLAVLRDSLFGERDASDLLIPRVPLDRLLPRPALAWLAGAGTDIRLRTRVVALERVSGRWRVRTGDEDLFDGAIVATSAPEAARLCATVSPAWSAAAASLAHEPVATVWLSTPRRTWPAAMLALPSDSERRPAQFAFRLPASDAAGIATSRDHVTLVASAATPWVERGLPDLRAAAIAQAREALGFGPDDALECVGARVDRRATFRCVAGIVRPCAQVADGLVAAGDYVDGPYPATLEAAVRAGEAAATTFNAPDKVSSLRTV